MKKMRPPTKMLKRCFSGDNPVLVQGTQSIDFPELKNIRRSSHSISNQFARMLWAIAYTLMFRPSPKFAHFWRRTLLRCFGAKVSKGVKILPSVTVWAPWNIKLGDYCSIGNSVELYSVSRITIGEFATISSQSVLCTATHDYQRTRFPLIVKDIVVEPYAWVCSQVFVMPGVRIGKGAVVGVRSTVFGDIPEWVVAVGTPCNPIKTRTLR